MVVHKSIFFFLFAVTLSLVPSLRAQEQEDYEVLPNPIVAASDSGAYHAINQLPTSIRQSAPFAREFYEFARHAGTSGTVDNDAYLATFAQAQQDMLRSSYRTAGKNSPQAIEGTWSNIGLIGNDTSNTPSAGITTAIVFDPQHANIMYAGGEGGVWKSYDTGASWTNLTDNVLPNLAVGSVAVDPINTNIVYIGSGYCYDAIPSYGGSGLYKSTDGGQTFARLTVPSGTQFVKVVVDPAHDSIVLASSYDQGIVYRSTDFGVTWKSVFSSGIAWDMIAIPKQQGTFYLISGNAASSGGVYKSTNDGVTWTKTTTATNFLAADSIGRCALASPTNAPNKIVALISDAQTLGGQNFLYESTDAGTTWSKDNTIPGGLFAIPGTTIFHPQGWYDVYLGITPNSITDDTIYAGGVLAFEKSGGLWDEFSDYNDGHQEGIGGYPHSDHHSFAVNPINSNIVYDGDDGGLWINYAAGSNDIASGGGWQLHSSQMVTSRFNHVSSEISNNNITWAGAQDQGLWKITTGGIPVQQAPLGDAMGAIVSPVNAQHVYGEGPEGQIYLATNLTNPNWELTADSSLGVTDAVSWDARMAMAPIARGGTSASSILYVGRQHLWQTTNAGTTWQKPGGSSAPSYGLTGDQVYYISAIGLPAWNDSLIYVSGGGSKFEMSTNFGTSWVARANPGTVTAIGATKQNTGFLVVSLEASKTKVMMSTDSGAKCVDVSGVTGAQIPGADANTSCNVMSIALDSINPLTTWYAATDFGVYQTSDAGQHWTFMGPGLFPCRDIQIASDRVTMRIATYGRGIWEVQLPIAFNGVETTSLSATKSTEGTALAWSVANEPQAATFYVERSVGGNGFIRIDSTRGVGASTGTHGYSFLDNTTAPGTYLYQIHAIDASGAQLYSNTVELHYGTNGLYLYQPYPNPFVLGGNSASAVTLNFELPAMDNVQLRIYDVKGTLVRTLLDRAMDGGPQSANWDARDDAGNLVAPGAYFYSIQTVNSGMMSGKIMVVRE